MNIDDVISDNRSLIYSIAYHFRKSDVEDLYQVGCIGLLRAYKNYNSAYNTKFATYAYPYIVGEMYHYLNYDKTLKMNNDLVKLSKNIKKAQEYLTQKLYRVPSNKEIADFLEIDVLKLEEINNLLNVQSIDYEYEQGTMRDFIENTSLDKDTLIDLKDALLNLDENERSLIIKRYFYNMNQESIAKDLMVNQVKVSRDEKKILKKMRSFMIK